jgi:hypothetical protein
MGYIAFNVFSTKRVTSELMNNSGNSLQSNSARLLQDRYREVDELVVFIGFRIDFYDMPFL